MPYPYKSIVAEQSSYTYQSIEDDLAVIKQASRNPRNSDEDTEDASENDQPKPVDEFTEIKEQMYRDKLAYLKKQLDQLSEGNHPEYCRKLKKLENMYRDRLLLNEIWKQYEIERAEQDYIREKCAAARDFEEKKVELRENLIHEYEEKKRMVESERHGMELTGDSMEIKPVTTRKLRRRPNDPAPVPEKRRKNSPNQLNLLLEESEINDDLRTITRGKPPPVVTTPAVNSTGRRSPAHSSSPSPGSDYGAGNGEAAARVEDGKLFFERRWFHRGQTVIVESKKARFSGVITAISSEVVWIRHLADNSKVRIYVWQLSKGKFAIRRKAA